MYVCVWVWVWVCISACANRTDRKRWIRSNWNELSWVACKFYREFTHAYAFTSSTLLLLLLLMLQVLRVKIELMLRALFLSFLSLSLISRKTWNFIAKQNGFIWIITVMRSRSHENVHAQARYARTITRLCVCVSECFKCLSHFLVFFGLFSSVLVFEHSVFICCCKNHVNFGVVRLCFICLKLGYIAQSTAWIFHKKKRERKKKRGENTQANTLCY